jgi:hypothetical protein
MARARASGHAADKARSNRRTSRGGRLSCISRREDLIERGLTDDASQAPRAPARPAAAVPRTELRLHADRLTGGLAGLPVT